MLRTAVIAILPLLSGCALGTVANTAVGAVTLPVKVVSKGVDLATTSQSEADRNRGRALRLLEQRCSTGRPLPQDRCPPHRQR